jgi:hypothetical protein
MLLLLPERRCICATLIVLMQIRLLERALLEAKKQKPEGCYFTFCITRHTSHVTRHTSHVTRHTSHATRYTPHVTRVLQPQPHFPRRWLWRRRAAAVHARQAMRHAVQLSLNQSADTVTFAPTAAAAATIFIVTK